MKAKNIHPAIVWIKSLPGKCSLSTVSFCDFLYFCISALPAYITDRFFHALGMNSVEILHIFPILHYSHLFTHISVRSVSQTCLILSSLKNKTKQTPQKGWGRKIGKPWSFWVWPFGFRCRSWDPKPSIAGSCTSRSVSVNINSRLRLRIRWLLILTSGYSHKHPLPKNTGLQTGPS